MALHQPGPQLFSHFTVERPLVYDVIIVASYAYPAEVFILGAGTICGPLLYCYFTRNLHLITVFSWIVLRLFQAIDAHSGYGQ